MDTKDESSARRWVAKTFSWIEDVVYIGLGALLAGCALTLLGSGTVAFYQNFVAGTLAGNIIDLLDRLLLVLLIVEVMFTVQVSFREHTLAPEPFLVVGLIAVVRRLLVLTAELPQLLEKGDAVVFQQVSIELALLALLIVALVASVVLLRRHPIGKAAERVVASKPED